jgi:hypothetical protein
MIESVHSLICGIGTEPVSLVLALTSPFASHVSCPGPSFKRSLTFCRIGGAIPTVFSYFAEVLAREKRGEHLSWLCMFWMIGGVYASAMAWAIIPHYGKGLAPRQPADPFLFQLPPLLLSSLLSGLRTALSSPHFSLSWCAGVFFLYRELYEARFQHMVLGVYEYRTAVLSQPCWHPDDLSVFLHQPVLQLAVLELNSVLTRSTGAWSHIPQIQDLAPLQRPLQVQASGTSH